MPTASVSSMLMWFVLFSIDIHAYHLEGGRVGQKNLGFWSLHQLWHTAEGQRMASGMIPAAEWQGCSLGCEPSLNAMGTQLFLCLSETKAGVPHP